MSSVIKGNRPLRIFAGMVFGLLIVAHFMEQVDLTQISFLWLIIAMSINAFQASFSGFCPMFKNAKGECVACGVACDKSADASADTSKPNACCSGAAADCCTDATSKSDKACCTDNDCCTDSTDKSTDACCDNPKSSDGCSQKDCCSESNKDANNLIIKVLGSGCKNCDTTAKLIEKVAAEHHLTIQLVKVEDVAEIASYGVMSTPAVVMDEEVVHSGSIPTTQQIQAWLSKR